jgi:flagellar hook assembly protein FlgD
LNQNYPNPFNPTTVIEYDLKNLVHVKLSVYNMLGQKVRTLVDKDVQAGNHSVTWNGTDDLGRNVGSGIYLASIQAGEKTKTIKMVLVR